MARGKKKETLIPEERLQAALVPESEQPYKVPANWCWTYLTKGAAECLDSFRKPINASERANREGDIPYYGATGQVGWIDDFLTNEQLVLVGEDGAPFLDLIKDKAYIIEGKAWVNNHAHILRSRFGTVGNLFLMHYLNIFNYHDFVNGTTRLKLTQGSMDIMPVPVPPLSEQQRIVDRIESMFAKLDEAKQKAQDALDSFETRKSAILHKAFTGELTAQWRREHSMGIESWEERTIVDLCSMIIDCPHSTPEWSDKGKICLRTTNIKDGYLDLSDVRYVTDDIFDQRNRRAVPQAGDVLLTREGNIGDVGVIPENVEICLGQRMMLLRPNKCQSAFLIYFFRNPKILTDIKAGTMGSTAPRMNIKDIKQLKIHCPNDKEQAEIVRILDDLLAKEQQAKEVAEGVLEQIDLIKKSVLARAFRGELGTNDPSEESAIKLLERSFSGTIEIEKVKTKQVAKQKAEVIFVSKTIMEALSKGVRLTPENLKSETELPIDDFYARLKELIDNGSVVESRENGESYLEAGNENRQAENQ